MESTCCRPLPCTRPLRLRPTVAPPSSIDVIVISHAKRRTSTVTPPKMSLSSSPPPESSPDKTEAEGEPEDPVKLAFSKAAAYRKEKAASKPDVPDSVKLAMEKAMEYKKKGNNGGGEGNPSADAGTQRMQTSNSNYLKDTSNKESPPKSGVSVSSIDFMGLDFSDKKRSRGLPAGLAPITEFPEGDFQEVEIIIGDTAKFGNPKPSQRASDVVDDPPDLYKPKVSTWGVFPRPENISKTFGGGRNIRPGEALETAEVKAAREARSRELIARYKEEIDIKIDLKTKAECEKALRDGDHLMDKGKLTEALPYYEKVMKTLVFKSELHGLAALQWSICQDSLTRHDEARIMYEKLQSHPNIQVSKKAKQFMFSFEAMEMMKISSLSASRTTGYESYFDNFLENKTSYTATEEQDENGSLRQTLPYVLLIFSPILIVLYLAVAKGTNF